MDQPSPYTPGVVAKEVPGRAVQVDFFRERAQYIGVLGRFSGRIVVYFAPRGIGKTSLLRSGQRLFRANKIRTVWVTANEDENLLATILSEIRAILPAGSKALKSVLEAIETVTLTAGLPGTGVKTTLKKPAEPSGSKAFQRAVVSATAAIIADGDNGLVILVDEIQSADETSLRVIAHGWQELSDPEHEPAAGLFAVGLPGSQEDINTAVTFSERFDFIELPDLDDGGAAEALVEPAKQIGVAWERSAVLRAVAEAQRYPYKVQLIGEETWKAARYPDKGTTINVQNVIDGLPEVKRQMRSLYAARWRSASTKQREFIVAVAGLGGRRVRREDVAKALGKDTRAISVPRDRLLRRGIIEATEHGLISFTVPGFTEYVVEIAD